MVPQSWCLTYVYAIDPLAMPSPYAADPPGGALLASSLLQRRLAALK